MLDLRQSMQLRVQKVASNNLYAMIGEEESEINAEAS